MVTEDHVPSAGVHSDPSKRSSISTLGENTSEAKEIESLMAPENRSLEERSVVKAPGQTHAGQEVRPSTSQQRCLPWARAGGPSREVRTGRAPKPVIGRHQIEGRKGATPSPAASGDAAWATTCPLLGFARHLLSPEPALWVHWRPPAVVLTRDLQPEGDSGKNVESLRICAERTRTARLHFAPSTKQTSEGTHPHQAPSPNR